MDIILAIHNHQPVGNMDFILEDAYEHSYKPFLEILEKYRDIRINIHYSGYLFQWLEEKKPRYIDLLKKLHNRGQIEIMSGGMYEPVLALIPEEDALDQVRLHMDLMEETFGDRPRGAWLTERVYEPQIPKILKKAGISYTIVDDNHFRVAGISQEELFGSFMTEYSGSELLLFPGLEFLRYAIPFKPIEALDEYFRELESQNRELAVFGDDGEKFGLWPGTFQSVYQEGWLENFFSYLSNNREWLDTVTFSEYVSRRSPRGIVYLDCASYKEMGEWCLPASRAESFNECRQLLEERYGLTYRGGYYKHFLVKYPECNEMHKKMMRVSKKVRKNSEARKYLFMAQCNDAYWHGVFGGLYLPHLRSSVFANLIEAEKKVAPKKPYAEALMEDINADGWDEALVHTDCFAASFLLKEGGALYELDFRPRSVNIMATLARRYEGYHDKIRSLVSDVTPDGTKTIHDMVLAKEKNLQEYLVYDWHRRVSFIDHVMGRDISLQELHHTAYREPGDFVREPYTCTIEREGNSARLVMGRTGHYWKEGRGLRLDIGKTFSFEGGSQSLEARYSLKGESGLDFLFGIECNFSFLGSGGERKLSIEGGEYPLTTKDVLPPSAWIACTDPYQGIEVSLSFDAPVNIWTFPVEVVSLSESGFERNYQGTMVMPVWHVSLTGDEEKIINVKLHVKEL